MRKKDETSLAGSIQGRERNEYHRELENENKRKRETHGTSDRRCGKEGQREVCNKDDQWILRRGAGRGYNVSRGCDKDGASGGTNKTDEIAHWCFDMGQIMFDMGDPCLVWLIARYMCVYAFFRRFDTRFAAGRPRDDGIWYRCRAGCNVPQNRGKIKTRTAGKIWGILGSVGAIAVDSQK